MLITKKKDRDGCDILHLHFVNRRTCKLNSDQIRALITYLNSNTVDDIRYVIEEVLPDDFANKR
jgi:ribosomal protein S15P/S13E